MPGTCNEVIKSHSSQLKTCATHGPTDKCRELHLVWYNASVKATTLPIQGRSLVIGLKGLSRLLKYPQDRPSILNQWGSDSWHLTDQLFERAEVLRQAWQVPHCLQWVVRWFVLVHTVHFLAAVFSIVAVSHSFMLLKLIELSPLKEYVLF